MDGSSITMAPYTKPLDFDPIKGTESATRSAGEGATFLKPLLEEFGDLADELARKHRVPTELVGALLALEGTFATELDHRSEASEARHVEAVLRERPFEHASFGKR